MTEPATPQAQSATSSTPHRAPLLFVLTTVAIAGVVLTTSLLGLFAYWPYAAETPAWRLQAHGQDLGNLLAVATLLAALLPAARGSVAALGVWTGALLYLCYAFAIYAFAIHFGPLFLLYLAVMGASVYAAGFGLRQLQGVTIARKPLNLGAAVIASVAVLFALLWLASIIPALLVGRAPAELAEAGLTTNPVHVLDLAIVLPAMLITAVLARRGSGPSQTLIVPWLVFTALMAASVAITLMMADAWVPAALLITLVITSVLASIRVCGASMPVRCTVPALDGAHRRRVEPSPEPRWQ